MLVQITRVMEKKEGGGGGGRGGGGGGEGGGGGGYGIGWRKCVCMIEVCNIWGFLKDGNLEWGEGGGMGGVEWSGVFVEGFVEYFMSRCRIVYCILYIILYYPLI